jgi:hypothetical protein
VSDNCSCSNAVTNDSRTISCQLVHTRSTIINELINNYIYITKISSSISQQLVIMMITINSPIIPHKRGLLPPSTRPSWLSSRTTTTTTTTTTTSLPFTTKNKNKSCALTLNPSAFPADIQIRRPAFSSLPTSSFVPDSTFCVGDDDDNDHCYDSGDNDGNDDQWDQPIKNTTYLLLIKTTATTT